MRMPNALPFPPLFLKREPLMLFLTLIALAGLTGESPLFAASTQAAWATNGPASSEIRKEANGFWLYVDGARSHAVVGVVYQPTEGSRHINSYTNSLGTLYEALDDERRGGRSHGARLGLLGMQAIRIYQLPVENAEDVAKVKAIFRHFYSMYQIKVLVGDWAGLNAQVNFRKPEDLTRLRQHLRRLVATYGSEPWLLGWQLGNENNYHTLDGSLGNEINLSAAEYYTFMDGLAGVVKQELGRLGLRQWVALGQGELTETEAGLIGNMKNFDAVGINCYRDNPKAFGELINLATSRFDIPIYFAEVGKATYPASPDRDQGNYLTQICAVILSHSAGRNRSGRVLGVFVHELTDQPWKRTERGEEKDAHYGILDKPAEPVLRQFLRRQHDFDAWIVPTNDAPDNLLNAAWNCLKGFYPEKYGRDYGNAMAYASRAVTLYEEAAQKQQLALSTAAPASDAASSRKFWALNTVGTGYYIIGNCWMLQAYDKMGAMPAQGPIQNARSFLGKAPALLEDDERHQALVQNGGVGVQINSVTNFLQNARDSFEHLVNEYPDARLRQTNGKYQRFDRIIQTTFPELSKPYVRPSWTNALVFTSVCLGLILLLSSGSIRSSTKGVVRSTPVMEPLMRSVFLFALASDILNLFFLMAWWIHPVRMKFFIVQPVLFWLLTCIGIAGALFYFYIWHLIWSMRKAEKIEAEDGLSVAMVTTRVVSETIDDIEDTLRRMDRVSYPHDSYLLDEENSSEAQFRCKDYNVIHFSRRGIGKYNRRRGRFQKKTKGGNLNAWLYEFGHKYEFVTFLDPDHAPHQNFLHSVLGYFRDPKVGFVQGAQIFHNRNVNWIARGAAEQNYFFSGPIQMGLCGIGVCVVNGSHSTFRVRDLLRLKGRGYAVHDADDILTSLRMHAAGQLGVYVPEIIAEGRAPHTWEEYAKQQRRWASSMFDLVLHYYIGILPRLSFKRALAYLVLGSFYMGGVAFAGLLFIPFVSVFLGNPPVNADLASFCGRFLPFLVLHYGVLLFLGQRYIVPNGSERGFWYRAGILWMAAWWEFLRAFARSIPAKEVKDREVTDKYAPVFRGALSSVCPHILLVVASVLTILWSFQNPARIETVWGSLLFLGLIIVSQGYVALRILLRPRSTDEVKSAVRGSHL